MIDLIDHPILPVFAGLATSLKSHPKPSVKKLNPWADSADKYSEGCVVKMKPVIRNLMLSALVLTVLISCYGPVAEKALNKSLETFKPYSPSDSLTSANDGPSEIVTGVQHACALRAGTLWCWGLNADGQIGNSDGGFQPGVTDPVTGENPAAKVVLKPVIVMKGVDSIAVGFEHTCAVKSKVLYCWGSNAKGQLGIEGKSQVYEPMIVPTGEAISQVKANGYFTCALSDSGRLSCFGSRMSKVGSIVEPVLYSKTPLAIQNDGVTAFALSPNHVCMVQNESLKCLGYNGWGEIGDSTRMGQEVPSFFSVFTQKTTQVVAADGRSCAMMDGKMFCFGMTLGDRAVDNTPAAKWKIPSATPTEATFWNGIAPGLKMSASGALLSSNNELFYGSFFHNKGVPKKIAVQVHDFDFSERDQNGCLMFKNLSVLCWGANNFGQLGNGTRAVSETAVTQASEVVFAP